MRQVTACRAFEDLHVSWLWLHAALLLAVYIIVLLAFARMSPARAEGTASPTNLDGVLAQALKEEAGAHVVEVRLRSGSKPRGMITAIGADGVALEALDGSSVLVAWRDMPAAEMLRIHEGLMLDAAGRHWLELAARLGQQRDGEASARAAVQMALGLDAQLAEEARAVLEEVRQRAGPDGAPPVAAAEQVEVALTDLQFGPRQLGRYITAMLLDDQGRLWLGTEGRGLWRYDWPDVSQIEAADGRLDALRTQGTWTHVTVEDGLGDPFVYALAQDQAGRIWVGHLNSGVSVYNGRGWKNYDVERGPLGERLFDMAICPKDADVWMATSRGLARYHVREDRWSYITRADGLLSDQIETIAFDSRGDLYAGTQCDGLLKGERMPDGRFEHWLPTVGPVRDVLPHSDSGRGLPSALINHVLVMNDGVVHVATPNGLASSLDGGNRFDYIRGRDWEARVKGLQARPTPYARLTPEQRWLGEDYVTTLAEGHGGTLWVGHRVSGVVGYDPIKRQRVPFAGDLARLDRQYIMGIVPLSRDLLAIGTYGQGVLLARTMDRDAFAVPTASSAEPAGQSDGSSPVVSHPGEASPPDLELLEHYRQQIARRKAREVQFLAHFLGDDWTTQGDWVGRYGRQYAVLCAHSSPRDLIIAHAPVLRHYQVDARIGLHRRPGDGLRLWIHQLEWRDSRVLYSPAIGTRRQADWDDHAEAYPITHEGPDVWIRVTVPEGVHRVTLYIFNKDGQRGNNRLRDYLIRVFEAQDNDHMTLNSPILARARVRDFWGGVHKQFTLAGPRTYDIQLACMGSFNTIVSGVFIDQLSGPRVDAGVRSLALLPRVRYQPSPLPWTAAKAEGDDPMTADVRMALRLWHELTRDAALRDAADLYQTGGMMAYRSLRQQHDGAELSILRWRLGMWDAQEREAFADAMRRGWRNLLTTSPWLSRTRQEADPGTRNRY